MEKTVDKVKYSHPHLDKKTSGTKDKEILKNKGFEILETITELKVSTLPWIVNDIDINYYERTSPINEKNVLSIGVLNTQATYFKEAYDNRYKESSIKRKGASYNE